MKKKISLFMVVAVFVFALTVFATGRINASKEDDRITEYENVFNEVKAEYGIELVFDKDAVLENVLNKMTIDEFRQSLIDSQQAKSKKLYPSDYDYDIGEDKKKLIDFSSIQPLTSGGIVTFHNYYNTPDRYGLLWADFWHVDLGTIQYFDSFVKAGTGTNKVQWYFKGTGRLVSFSQSLAKVEYQGYWTWGPTGFSEPLLIKTTSTYRPN